MFLFYLGSSDLSSPRFRLFLKELCRYIIVLWCCCLHCRLVPLTFMILLSQAVAYCVKNIQFCSKNAFTLAHFMLLQNDPPVIQPCTPKNVKSFEAVEYWSNKVVGGNIVPGCQLSGTQLLILIRCNMPQNIILRKHITIHCFDNFSPFLFSNLLTLWASFVGVVITYSYNIMLIQIMHIFWFYLIARMAYAFLVQGKVSHDDLFCLCIHARSVKKGSNERVIFYFKS